MELEQNEKYTIRVINKAFIDVMSKEMDYFDAYYTDTLVDKLCQQNFQNLVKEGNFDIKTAKERIDTLKYAIPTQVLNAYGWTPYDVKVAIIKYLPEDYKNLLVDVEKSNEEEGEM